MIDFWIAVVTLFIKNIFKYKLLNAAMVQQQLNLQSVANNHPSKQEIETCLVYE